MIKREYYLKRLNDLKDTNLIKILSGVRRCGKSTILEQFIKQLNSKNIIYYNFENLENDKFINDWKLLHSTIKNKLKNNQQNYIFLDEIQNVTNWQKVVDSLYIKKNTDIYITGSNAYLLSSELSTLLSGRFIEISIYPFSLSEFALQFPKLDKRDIFDKYILFGGFPETSNFLKRNITSEINPYLEALYKTIIEKDISQKHRFNKPAELLRILKFTFDSIGSELSFTNIANALKNNYENKTDKSKMSVHTIDKYISAFINSYIIYQVPRYDERGKQILKTLQKYYSVDTGLVNSILGREVNYNYGHLLENIVFLELKRRYKIVNIGKIYNKEIDFITTDYNGDVDYFQIAWNANNQDTLLRELEPLQSVRNHNPKYLLTTDADATNYSGIKKRNVIDWLMN